MKRLLRKPVAFVFGVALLLLIAVGATALLNLVRYMEATEWVSHTQQVLQASERTLSQVMSAEAAQRGYMLLQEQRFLTDYSAGVAAAKEQLAALRGLSSDSPMQQQRLNALEPLLAQRFAWADYVMRLRREQGLQAAMDATLSGRGMELTNAIQSLLSEIEAEENRLLARRARLAESKARVGSSAMVSGSALAFALLLVAAWTIARHQRELHAAREQLESRVDERTVELRDTLERYSVTLEELQTTSEELEMVNEELGLRNAELTASQTSLKEQRQRYLELFDFAPDGYLVTDANGVIEEANRAAERLLGAGAERLLGMPLSAFFEGEERSVLLGHMDQVLRTGEWQDCELRLHPSRGAPFWAVLSASVRRDGEGRVTGLRWLLHDGTERRRAEEAVRRERDFAESMIETAQAVVLVLDMDGRIVRFNPFTEELSGYRLDEVHGQDWFAVFLPERDRDHFRSVFRQVVAGESTRGVINPIVACNGRERSIEWSSRTLTDAEGRAVGVLSIGLDVTERQRVERLKAEFISTVSHELRTPLTSIAGSLGLLRGGIGGDLPGEARSLVDIAWRNSERLVLLVNDLLDIDKIESGQMSLSLRPVDLMRVVEETVEMNRAYAEQLKVTLALNGGLSGVRVYADPGRLTQVLTNLLSNAAKFSPREDTVVVSVSRHEHSVRVAVTDHGPGVPEGFRERMFEKFSQADASDTRARGGTGLGLSISKAIVERFSGRIDFEPAPGGRGTTFYVELPEWTGEA